MRVKLKLVHRSFDKIGHIDLKIEVAEGTIGKHRFRIIKETRSLLGLEYIEDFRFIDLDKGKEVGRIKVHVNDRSYKYDCDYGLSTDYLGSIDNLEFLTCFIYRNPCWKEELVS